MIGPRFGESAYKNVKGAIGTKKSEPSCDNDTFNAMLFETLGSQRGLLVF